MNMWVGGYLHQTTTHEGPMAFRGIGFDTYIWINKVKKQVGDEGFPKPTCMELFMDDVCKPHHQGWIDNSTSPISYWGDQRGVIITPLLVMSTWVKSPTPNQIYANTRMLGAIWDKDLSHSRLKTSSNP